MNFEHRVGHTLLLLIPAGYQSDQGMCMPVCVCALHQPKAIKFVCVEIRLNLLKLLFMSQMQSNRKPTDLQWSRVSTLVTYFVTYPNANMLCNKEAKSTQRYVHTNAHDAHSFAIEKRSLHTHICQVDCLWFLWPIYLPYYLAIYWIAFRWSFAFKFPRNPNILCNFVKRYAFQNCLGVTVNTWNRYVHSFSIHLIAFHHITPFLECIPTIVWD